MGENTQRGCAHGCTDEHGGAGPAGPAPQTSCCDSGPAESNAPAASGCCDTEPAAPRCCGSDPSADDQASAARSGATARFTFRVQGLDCAEEVAILKREVGPLVGGEERLAFDVLNGRMMVLPEADDVTADAIITAIGRSGMSAREWQAGQEDSGDPHRRKQIGFTAGSGVALAIGSLLHVGSAGGLAAVFAGHAVPLPAIVAYLLSIGLGVRFVLPKALFAARRIRPDMNLLMTVAVAGAMGIGEWFEAATVAFLFALSLALEGWSVGRARRAVSALLDLAPSSARIRRPDGTESEVPAEDVATGTRVIVRPGERIPLDGCIVAGEGSIDQAPITGESMPISKGAGAEVFAGTINGDSVLEMETTKLADQTTLARITRMVSEAHSRRAPAEQWVEKFARIYTPAVLAAAVLIWLVPPLALGGAWGEWFYRALVLLVIACPCALVISTPVSIVSALACSARQGVLVKGGLFIEQPARVQAIAFDKTGTLTRGNPEVVSVVAFGGHSEAELLERAAALEERSTHPLARAITAYAAERGVRPQAADQVQVIQGKGVAGTYDHEPFWLGSHRYAAERGHATAEMIERAQALEEDGRTVIAVGNDRHVCGLLAVADRLRPNAAEVVRELRDTGLAHVVMLTGDNAATAAAIAREAGIDEVHAELLPDEKVSAIERLVDHYGSVAMVGDGVNDAPAMARASYGVAMGAAGSDAAIETADIALMTDDLERLPWLHRHSNRTLGIIRQNVVFALGVKAAFVIATVLGLASLWGAIAADLGASLLVTVNALRLLHARSGPSAGPPVAHAPAGDHQASHPVAATNGR